MLAFILLFPFIATAEVRLVPIEVQAAPSAPLMRRSETPVWRAGEAQLQEASTPQEVMNKAPGVFFAQNGGVGAPGRFFLRGGESRHSLFVVDGIRQNDVSNTDRGFDTAFFLTPFYQDMLFLRGPAPTLYGGDATSGVVELVPRRGRTPKETVLSLSGGSFDTFQGFGLQDWSSGNHQGTAGILYLRSRGFSRLNRRRWHATEPDGAETTQAYQASRHRWSDRLVTDFFAQGVVGQADQDGFGVDAHGDHINNQSATVSQTTAWDQGAWRWHLRSGVNSIHREIYTSTLNQFFRGQTRVVSAFGERKFASGEVLMGANAEQEWLGTPGLHVQNDTGSLFILPKWKTNHWVVELGARGEHNQRYRGFLAEDALLKYQGESWSAHAKGALGYKAPSMYQLYAPPSGGLVIGNSNLRPEHNTAMEMGVQWEKDWRLGGVLFQQDFHDLITYVTSEGYQNRGTLRVQGLELSALAPEKNWGQLNSNLTFLRFDHYSQTPLRRPPYIITLEWLKDWGRHWRTGVNGRAIGVRQDQDADSHNSRLGAYQIFGVNLKWLPDERQEWILSSGNVTDRRYEDVWGFSTAPANLMLKWLGRF